jgi:hypothetical protein
MDEYQYEKDFEKKPKTKTQKYLERIFGVGSIIALFVSMNYMNNYNNKEEEGNYESIKKVDGVFSYTTIEYKKPSEDIINRIEITQKTPYSVNFYLDKEGDGHIDYMYSEIYSLFDKNEVREYEKVDSTTNKDVFMKADKIYHDELKRFDLEQLIKKEF